MTEVPPVLTACQEQVWFFDQLVPGATFHTVPVYVDITGPLDVDALTAALCAVVNRHEPLRTSYEVRAERVVPRTLPHGSPTIDVRDLRGSADQEAEVRALTDAELATPVDLGSGLPLRAVLLRLADTEHRLLLLVHHIAIDGASVALLQTELLWSYQAAVDGRDTTLPVPAAGYHALAQRSRHADHGAGLRRREQVLADLPEPLELPGARSRPTRPDYAADSLELVVPEPLAGAVRRFAKDSYSSPFMVLLTAFSVLLHRLTGARDLVIGTPSAGRETDDAQDLIGYFINLLALRVRLDWDPTSRAAMTEVRDAVLTALEDRETPFHEVVRAVQAERDLDRHPVFQLVFACPPPLAPPSTAGGCVFAFTQGTSREALYDLELQLADSGAGDLRGWLKFRTAVHDRPAMVDLADRFLTVLAQVTGSPDTHLSNLSLVDPSERHRLTRGLNDNATDYPAQASLPELFHGIADRFPDEIAVEYGDTRLSYTELDRAANQLAHHLGALHGEPVGIRLPRGVDWLVSALAILKAGGAYLPLDQDYPTDRVAALCADSGATTVITDSAERALPELRTVDLSTAPAAAMPIDRPVRTPAPDDLAYVMFTSGSTGTPKGVEVSHRNVVRLVRDVDYVEFRAGDGVAQASTTTFDAATFEIWGALLNGGRLVGVPKDIILQPNALGEWLRDNEIDTLFLTTSVAMHVAGQAPEALSTLRCFVFGGEQPDTHAVAALAAHPGGPGHIVNGYGPTETTTFASAHRCDDVAATDRRIPLGRALNNCAIYVLDSYLEPVPPGVVGELCIGGDGVGRGYVGAPGATAERFVPDHLGGRPGDRLYRTGDLARLLPDGTVEYLGRADRQVKIRGFRIEPAEIEAALRSAESVREAVVVPKVAADGDADLVGYVVLDDPGTERIAAIMDHLRAVLPAYLVPSALVPMASFPLTANGKLDLRALPEPHAAAPATVDTEPLTPTEHRLAELWQAVLGTGRIGRDANFFDLGGHSLKATRLVTRIAADLRVDVPLRVLFDHPTVAGLAVEVERLRALTPAAAAAPAPRAVRTGLSLGDLLDTVTDR